MKNAVAQALLEIGAVGFRPDDPVTFKSGLVSPVYIDNRVLPFYPKQWQIVIAAFAQLIQDHDLSFDCIAGIESAGIPHSAALGFHLQKPSLFIRKQAKEHGTKKVVEGGSVNGKRVLLIEDHVTTGISSLHGVDALRAEGGTATDCLAITSYFFAEGKDAFAQKQVALHTLTDFDSILAAASERGMLSDDQRASIADWLAAPWEWKERKPVD